MKTHTNAKGIEARVNHKYHFPSTINVLERYFRMALGLPFKGRMGGEIPYAYKYVLETDTYEPNEEIMHLLWQAKKYLHSSSLREVAIWLNFKVEKLGYKDRVSFEGLRNIMFNRPPYEECLLPKEQKEKILESLTTWTSRQT